MTSTTPRSLAYQTRSPRWVHAAVARHAPGAEVWIADGAPPVCLDSRRIERHR